MTFDGDENGCHGEPTDRVGEEEDGKGENVDSNVFLVGVFSLWFSETQDGSDSPEALLRLDNWNVLCSDSPGVLLTPGDQNGLCGDSSAMLFACRVKESVCVS